ncbi:MAG: hypothetical protein SNJ31_01615 [Rikenellaceae bacterium]
MAASCEICGEPIPPHSRICPNCLLNASYSAEIQGFESPVKMLSIMRSSVDEYLSIKSPKIWSDRVESREIIATFECVRDVVMIAFGDNSDVVDAVAAMEDLFYERIEQHRQYQKRCRCLLIISVIALIFSLFALIY